MEQSSKAKESNRVADNELLDLDKRTDDKTSDMLETDKNIKALELKLGPQSNTASMDKAVEYTVKLNGRYEDLAFFWKDLEAAFVTLRKEIETGGLYTSLKSGEYADSLETICKKATEHWAIMSRNCAQAETTMKGNITEMFAFMSINYDGITTEEKQKIIADLSQSIDDNDPSTTTT